MMTPDDNRHPFIVARYEAAKAAAHDLRFQLLVTRKSPFLFVLEEDGNTVRTFADVAHIDAFLQGVQNARSRRQLTKRMRRAGAKRRTSPPR